MTYDLEVLAEEQNTLLLAELGVWLHILGKFSREFVERKHPGKSHEVRLPDDYLELLPQSNCLILLQDRWPHSTFTSLSSLISDLQASDLPENLYLFSKFHRRRGKDAPNAHGKIKRPAFTGLVIDAHGRGSGTEKGLFDDHTCNPMDATHTHLDTVFGYTSSPLDLRQLDTARDALYTFLEGRLNELKDSLTNKRPVDWLEFRQKFVKRLQEDFLTTVGDTRRPINDVSLFDQTFATVAFFKTALVQNLLSGQWQNPLDKNVKYKWRLLRLGIDGLNFLERAQSASDVVARRKVLAAALDKVREYLEISLPLIVEAYRDENGSVYLLPDIPNLLELQALDGKSLRQCLIDTVSNTLSQEVVPDISDSDQPSRTLYAFGQLVNQVWPALTPEPNTVNTWWSEVQAGIKIGDKVIHNLEVCAVCGLRPIIYGVEHVYEPGQVEYHREAAYDRKVCGFCLERREGRSKEWMKQISQPSESTIWIDEVANGNGRVALLIGQFDIKRWLTGELISSLTTVDPANIRNSHSYENLLTEIHGVSDATSLDSLPILCSLLSDQVKSDLKTVAGLRDFIIVDADLDQFQSQLQAHELMALALIRKTPSFARLRRVWETTRRFWQEVLPTDENTNIVASIAAQVIGSTGPRLEIKGSLAPADDRHQSPGSFHTYELRLGQTRLSVVWDPDHSRFITCDNLAYATQLLRKDVKTAITGKLTIEEPAGYGSQNKEWGTIAVDQVQAINDKEGNPVTYTPAIPILAEPRTFMALVPADKALDLAQAIKTKYEREMGKVRNRLPLHLGVVYFHRRTPLRAALDAGRRMLRQKPLGGETTWTVQETPAEQPGDKLLDPELKKDTAQFEKWYAVELKQGERELTWRVPAVMGDGATEDVWYPYVFLETDNDDSRVNGRQRAFKGLRPTANGAEACWLVHVADLRADDRVYFTPATLDFEWLDTTGRRFEIAYDENGRRRGRFTRPYLLDELEALQMIWNTLSYHLTTNQIYILRDLVEARRLEWQVATNDPTFRQFCREAIANTGWLPGVAGEQSHREGNKPWEVDGEDKPVWLSRWADYAAHGWLNDVVELYLQVMKAEPETAKKKEISQ